MKLRGPGALAGPSLQRVNAQTPQTGQGLEPARLYSSDAR